MQSQVSDSDHPSTAADLVQLPSFFCTHFCSSAFIGCEYFVLRSTFLHELGLYADLICSDAEEEVHT